MVAIVIILYITIQESIYHTATINYALLLTYSSAKLFNHANYIRTPVVISIYS